MSMENWFDSFTRLAGSGMPRRRMIKLTMGALTAATLGGVSWDRAFAGCPLRCNGECCDGQCDRTDSCCHTNAGSELCPNTKACCKKGTCDNRGECCEFGTLCNDGTCCHLDQGSQCNNIKGGGCCVSGTRPAANGCCNNNDPICSADNKCCRNGHCGPDNHCHT